MARRKAARHRGARPHHRRQNGTREFEGAETDLMEPARDLQMQVALRRFGPGWTT